MYFEVQTMLNERIKELRPAKRMTQVELANSLGLTKQCVSNWENDNVVPSIDMLVKLADYFCVSTDYLLGRDSGATLYVNGLTTEEVSHLRDLILDLQKKH